MPVTPPNYTPLPTPVPQRNDPTNFAVRADAFLAALPGYQLELDLIGDSAYANAVEAEESATSAAADKLSAANSAAEAAASAASALNAPGTNATSSTSLSIGIGSRTFTIQTGKAYSLGQHVIIANTATPSNYMLAQIQSYNSGTGSMTVTSLATSGSGTYTAWTISLTAPIVQPADSISALAVLNFIGY